MKNGRHGNLQIFKFLKWRACLNEDWKKIKGDSFIIIERYLEAHAILTLERQVLKVSLQIVRYPWQRNHYLSFQENRKYPLETVLKQLIEYWTV